MTRSGLPSLAGENYMKMLELVLGGHVYSVH